jgi:hypothetical protein
MVKIKQTGKKFHGMKAFVVSPEAYSYILMSQIKPPPTPEFSENQIWL